jgi:hypothetical protein
MYRLRRRELTVEALVVDLDAIKSRDDDLGGIAVQILPFRVGYEHEQLSVQASAGWGTKGSSARGSGMTQVNGETVSSWEETIDGTGIPEVDGAIGELEIGWKAAEWSTTGSLTRWLYPTFDGDLAFEDRVSGTTTWQRGRTSLSLTPFATRTRMYVRDAGKSIEYGAGASLHVGRELNRWLRLDAIGEAALSPYARLDGERLPSSRLGGQVAVALSGRVAR